MECVGYIVGGLFVGAVITAFIYEGYIIPKIEMFHD